MKELQDREEAVVIFQMGKVGSSSVYLSLKEARLGLPIHKVHHLTAEGVGNTEALSGPGDEERDGGEAGGGRRWNRLANRFEHGVSDYELLSEVARSRIVRDMMGGRRRWKVITIVREPIGREVSLCFRHIVTAHPEWVSRVGLLRRAVQVWLANFDEHRSDTCTWLTKELEASFGVDVYGSKFIPDQGFQIIHSDRCDLLTLRMEDLDRVFPHAVSSFLDVKRKVPLLRVNETARQFDSYRELLSGLRIPRSVCEKVYDSRYAKQFYSSAERERLIDKWSGGTSESAEGSETLGKDAVCNLSS